MPNKGDGLRVDTTVVAIALAAALILVPTTVFGAEFEATVLDAEGDPIAGAQVVFLEIDEEKKSDEQGRVSLEVDREGTHTLLIETERYEPKWAEFEAGPEERLERQFVLGEVDEPTAADETDDGEEREEVVVRTTTASPLENPVDYQPLETLDERQLQRRASNSYGEMLDGSPGVAMRSFGPAPSRPVIRGLGGERVLVLQNGERTGDVSSTAFDHQIASDPLEADRLEVVRGPASLMYGSSALGGVVNILDERIPREWPDGPFGEAGLYGATGQTTGAVAGTAGYGFDTGAVRGRLTHRQAGDMRTAGGGVVPDTGIRGTTADIGGTTETDDGTYGLSLSYQDLDFGLPEELDPDESVELQSRRLSAQARAERELDGFVDQLEWRLSANRYGHDEIETEFAEPGGAVEDRELELGYDIWAASSTVTARHEEIGPVERGAFGLQVRGRDAQLSGDEVLSPDAREGSVGGFVFEEIPLTDALRAQFGARPELHVLEPRDNEDFEAPDETTVNPTISGSAGLHLQATDQLEVGTQVARAHRTATVTELYSDAPHPGTGQYEIGDPELGNEIGYGGDLYTRWTSQLVETELSGFVNYVDDFIFMEPTGQEDEPSGLPVYEYGSADARLVGGELAVTLRPWRALEFGTVIDYVRGQRLEPEVQDLPSMPPLRARLEAGWNGDDRWSTIRVRTAGPQYRTAPHEESTSGYALFDLEGGFRITTEGTGAHNMSLRLDNALDTAYRDHLSRVGGIASPMPGRSLHATYRWVY